MAIFTNLYYAYQSSKKNDYPFSKMEMKGDWDWVIKASGTTNTVRKSPEERNAIKLNDIDITTKKSGALTLTVAEGYQARFKIVTQNHKYFTENMKTAPAKNQVTIQPTGLGYDERMELILFGGDYISIDVDEEHSGIYRFRVQLNDQFYNIEDPEKVNDEVWVELLEAREIDGDSEEEIIDDGNFIDDGTNDGGEIIFDGDGDGDGDGDDDDDDDDDDDKESNGMSWKGVLIIGAVVVGIVLLLRFARNSKASDSSNSTKSPSDGGSSGE